MGEIRAIAKADGHILTEEDEDYMIDSDGEVYYKPSMLVDVEKGNLMEMEVILKAPLDVAKSTMFQLPFCRWFTSYSSVSSSSSRRPRVWLSFPKLERKSALH